MMGEKEGNDCEGCRDYIEKFVGIINRETNSSEANTSNLIIMVGLDFKLRPILRSIPILRFILIFTEIVIIPILRSIISTFGKNSISRVRSYGVLRPQRSLCHSVSWF